MTMRPPDDELWIEAVRVGVKTRTGQLLLNARREIAGLRADRDAWHRSSGELARVITERDARIAELLNEIRTAGGGTPPLPDGPERDEV